ncbi:hypothetical protein D1614_05065 [Maribellus luteus]|uniref:Uncharacterized protein n=1 Tax=Maribellus luteus TaxID=2305463 RepID=A0A399T2S2_9BACT|nr:hypothetical protein [Maribellus luteus]RIJ50118.1 hypothetical protein D1614_05065 [Maribellus luteus]
MKVLNENKLKSGLKIEPTHYYVRFRPKDEKERHLIVRDTTLYVYDYPLDVEIKRGGTHYHDPKIPKNEITWQYTIVPIDYEFPKVQYQKLADLYLPEYGRELTELKSARIEHFDWLKLENEALRITGNIEEKTQNESTLKSTSWRPAGNIKVFDDIIDSYSTRIKIFSHYDYFYCDTGEPVNTSDPTVEAPAEEENTGEIPEGENICARPIYNYITSSVNSHYIPLEGVEVRARRWFTTYSDITDANGNYVCNGTFDRDANYSIKWERADFDIRDGSYGQAYFNGPDMTGDWNLVIRDEGLSPKSFLFAHIFRAAYTYYYKNYLWGIKTPDERGFLEQRLHIGGRVESNFASHFFDFNVLFQSSTVLIHQNDKNSQEIFGTTIHELAHVSHWDAGGFSDINWLLDNRMTESWAEGVEAVITNDVYDTNNYGTNQNRTIASMTTDGGDFDGYTSIVWDLIDNVNQRMDLYGGNTAYVNDRVSGYTLSQIENALPSLLGSWWTWRSNLVDDNNNPTEGYVTELFQQLN